ncbi:MAG: DUF1587 domain-containing protein, partial [Planctomycetota bacterium]
MPFVHPSAILLACCAVSASAADPIPDPTAFLQAHCTACHDQWVQEGGMNFEALGRDLSSAATRDGWIRAHDRLAAGEMPPPEDADLSDEERAAGVAALAAAIRTAEAARTPPSLRRLNRTEFGYALRDLLRTQHLNAAEALPAEPEAHGFDHIGSALRSSPVQLSRLLWASENALRQAAAIGPTPERFVDRRRFVDIRRFQITKDRVTIGEGDDAIAVLVRQPNTAQTPWRIQDFIPPYDAHYRIRLRAKAATYVTPGRTKLPIPRVGTDEERRAADKEAKRIYEIQPPGERLDPPRTGQVLGVYADTRRLGLWDVTGDWQELELTAFVAAGEELKLFIPTMDDRNGHWGKGHYEGPAIALDWIEIE